MADMWSEADLIDTSGTNVPATLYFVKAVDDIPVYVSGNDLTPINIKEAEAWFSKKGSPVSTFMDRLNAVYEWIQAGKPLSKVPEEEEVDLDSLF